MCGILTASGLNIIFCDSFGIAVYQIKVNKCFNSIPSFCHVRKLRMASVSGLYIRYVIVDKHLLLFFQIKRFVPFFKLFFIPAVIQIMELRYKCKTLHQIFKYGGLIFIFRFLNIFVYYQKTDCLLIKGAYLKCTFMTLLLHNIKMQLKST